VSALAALFDSHQAAPSAAAQVETAPTAPRPKPRRKPRTITPTAGVTPARATKLSHDQIRFVVSRSDDTTTRRALLDLEGEGLRMSKSALFRYLIADFLALEAGQRLALGRQWLTASGPNPTERFKLTVPIPTSLQLDFRRALLDLPLPKRLTNAAAGRGLLSVWLDTRNPDRLRLARLWKEQR